MRVHKFILGMLAVNCYIAADEKTSDAIIIDAPDKAETIMNFITEHSYHVQDIILTHGHYDHILALKKLKALTGAPVSIHENGKSFLTDDTVNLCSCVGISWEPIIPEKYLKDGDNIPLGSTVLKVLHTPGHTSDSICLLGDGILFSGDTLFCGSVGRTDFPTGSMSREITSIKQKLMPLEDSIRVYPGHGPETTIGNERKGNPYLQ